MKKTHVQMICIAYEQGINAGMRVDTSRLDTKDPPKLCPYVRGEIGSPNEDYREAWMRGFTRSIEIRKMQTTVGPNAFAIEHVVSTSAPISSSTMLVAITV